MLLTEWIFGVFVRAFGVTGSGPHLIENLLLYPWGVEPQDKFFAARVRM